jgi:hypothetical protein
LKNICPNNCRVCIIKCEIIYKNLKNIPNCWNKNCEKNIRNDIKKELIESKNTVIEMEKNIENLYYSNENSIVINENIQQKSEPNESPISSRLNKQINLSYRDPVVEKFIQNNNLNDDPKYNSMENNNQIEKNMIEKSNQKNNYFENGKNLFSNNKNKQIIENFMMSKNKISQENEAIIKCPKCLITIEIDGGGCNFMTCTSPFCQGKTNFCKICKRCVNPSEKLKHYPEGIYGIVCVNKLK